jgi:predicted nucleic-acid-binding protein
VPRSASVLPDTNVVLRYLLKDVPDQYGRAEKFFEDVRTGKAKAVILESVLVECVYILLKFYKVPKRQVAESLIGLLQYKGMANRDKADLVAALQTFAQQSIDIVDCVLLAKARHGTGRLLSFDKDLNKLGQISTDAAR